MNWCGMAQAIRLNDKRGYELVNRFNSETQAPKERQRIAHCQRNHTVMSAVVGSGIINNSQALKKQQQIDIRLCLKHWSLIQKSIAFALRGLFHLVVPLVLLAHASSYTLSPFHGSLNINSTVIPHWEVNSPIVCALCNRYCVATEMSVIEMVISRKQRSSKGVIDFNPFSTCQPQMIITPRRT